MSEADAARDTLGHLRYVKIPVVDYMSLTQRAKSKRHSEDPKEMRWIRNGFWTGAATLGGAGLVLTAGRIEGWFSPDTSIIVWSIALMLMSSVFAVVVQMTINKRVVIAEVRDARPVDHEVIGRLVAQQEAALCQIAELTKAVEMLSQQLDRAISDRDDEFVDTLSQQEDGQKVNGGKVTRLIRSRSYDPQWPKRT